MAHRRSLIPTEDDLELWIEAFRGPLVGLLASWGADWAAAEELAQDCFAEAWLSRTRFVGNPESLDAAGAWLRGIAFRLHSTAKRRAGTRTTSPLDADVPSAASREVDERRELLARAFAKLPAPQQTVLRMHYLEETSAHEVAALLGLTTKAVEDRLYQARRALRAIVEREAARPTQGARP